MDSPLLERFPALDHPAIRHALIQRIPGVDVQTDRETALKRLEPFHEEIRLRAGFTQPRYITAQQVHDAGVAIINQFTPSPVPHTDALVTNDPHVCLGVYVADCAPVWLFDPVRKVIACVHSGKKGTELGVVPAAIRTMLETYGCDAENIIAQIGPCIRPPHYEIDFASVIYQQCRDVGLENVFDCKICTASHLEKYYSYRREMGKTGRMLALIALRDREITSASHSSLL